MSFAYDRPLAGDPAIIEMRIRALIMEDANMARFHAVEIGDYASAGAWLDRMQQLAAQEDYLLPPVAGARQEDIQVDHHRTWVNPPPPGASEDRMGLGR